MMSSSITLEGLGVHVFKGAIAAPYLAKQGLAPDTLETPTWTTDGKADKVLIYQPFLNFSFYIISHFSISGCCCSLGVGY